MFEAKSVCVCVYLLNYILGGNLYPEVSKISKNLPLVTSSFVKLVLKIK